MVVITGITPRNDNPAVMPVINAANRQIELLADGKAVRYININRQLADAQDRLYPGTTYDGLHLTPQAYQHWANALKPIFTEVLGPPADQIHTVLNGRPNTAMAPFKQLSDTDLAAVITYTRNAWSNDTGQAIQPAEIQAARSK